MGTNKKLYEFQFVLIVGPRITWGKTVVRGALLVRFCRPGLPIRRVFVLFHFLERPNVPNTHVEKTTQHRLSFY